MSSLLADWHRLLAGRLTRISESPGRVALGFALGAGVACTPMIGLHFVLAVGAALATRASIPAAILGSFAANPWTYPLTLTGGYALGSWLLGFTLVAGASEDAPRLMALLSAVLAGDWGALMGVGPVIGAMMLGGIVLGITAGSVAYLAAWATLRSIRSQR